MLKIREINKACNIKKVVTTPNIRAKGLLIPSWRDLEGTPHWKIEIRADLDTDEKLITYLHEVAETLFRDKEGHPLHFADEEAKETFCDNFALVFRDLMLYRHRRHKWVVRGCK